MKKIFITALAVSILASMSVPVFAETESSVTASPAVETISVSDNTNTQTAPEYKEASIKSISEDAIVITDEEELTVDTLGLIVMDLNGDIHKVSDLKETDTVRYYAATNTLIDLDMIQDSINMVLIDEFKASETLGEYVESTNNLAINISDDTKIVDTEGNKLTKENLEGSYVAVFYNKSTMSIPAITNPEKVVVLGAVPMTIPAEIPVGSDENEETVEETTKYTVKTDDIIIEDGVEYLPIRKIAEGLGLEVAWNGDFEAVTVGTTAMGANFRIGENSYSKAKMTPVELSAAPILINDTTYVPTDFFAEILEVEIVVE